MESEANFFGEVWGFEYALAILVSYDEQDVLSKKRKKRSEN